MNISLTHYEIQLIKEGLIRARGRRLGLAKSAPPGDRQMQHSQIAQEMGDLLARFDNVKRSDRLAG